MLLPLNLSDAPYRGIAFIETKSYLKTKRQNLTMSDFNFVNQPTFHFYKWLKDGNYFNVSKLIEEAFEQLETDEQHALTDDTSLCLRNQLSQLLFDELEVSVLGVTEISSDAIGCVEPGDESDGAMFLVRPLVEWALSEIYFYVVAEKLLMDHGKWNPERERPEIL